MAGLKEDLRGKVKMDKPLNIVAAYRSVCPGIDIHYREEAKEVPVLQRNQLL